MIAQRTCGGCGGSGNISGPVFVPCPVCAGRGTVDAKASRADAVADALTLRWLVAGEWFGRPVSFALAAAKLKPSAYSYYGAQRAARAAFKAVPGLR